MPLLDEVRSNCAEIAAGARLVQIDLGAADALTPPAQGVAPELDPESHYLEGEPADVADYLLALDAINFGSGWFPTLRKRERRGRRLSGYFTVAEGLAEHVRAHGPPRADWLRGVDTRTIAAILGQGPDHELMSLYAQALRALGRFLDGRPVRRALDVVAECGGSAERLAEALAGRAASGRRARAGERRACGGMALFDDRGFYKRAQIVASDLALAGVAEFADLDRLTIFADNLVPHVLRCEGVLVYEESLAARIDAGEALPLGGPEREIRACALHACELISRRTGVPPRVLDGWLWNRGQAPEYKSRPRHRCRTVFY
jgi:hypothetical protein